MIYRITLLSLVFFYSALLKLASGHNVMKFSHILKLSFLWSGPDGATSRNVQFWAIATTYKCYYGKLLVGWDIQYNIMHIMINLGCNAYEFTRMIKRKIRILYEKWWRNKYKWTELSVRLKTLTCRHIFSYQFHKTA